MIHPTVSACIPDNFLWWSSVEFFSTKYRFANCPIFPCFKVHFFHAELRYKPPPTFIPRQIMLITNISVFADSYFSPALLANKNLSEEVQRSSGINVWCAGTTCKLQGNRNTTISSHCVGAHTTRQAQSLFTNALRSVVQSTRRWFSQTVTNCSLSKVIGWHPNRPRA